jgi:hypothetical protein
VRVSHLGLSGVQQYLRHAETGVAVQAGFVHNLQIKLGCFLDFSGGAVSIFQGCDCVLCHQLGRSQACHHFRVAGVDGNCRLIGFDRLGGATTGVIKVCQSGVAFEAFGMFVNHKFKDRQSFLNAAQLVRAQTDVQRRFKNFWLVAKGHLELRQRILETVPAIVQIVKMKSR